MANRYRPLEGYWQKARAFDDAIYRRARLHTKPWEHVIGTLMGVKVARTSWQAAQEDVQCHYMGMRNLWLRWPHQAHLDFQGASSQVYGRRVLTLFLNLGREGLTSLTMASVPQGEIGGSEAAKYWLSETRSIGAQQRMGLHIPNKDDYDQALNELERGASGVYEG